MTTKLLIAADLGHLKVYRIQEDKRSTFPRTSLLASPGTEITRHLAEVVTDQAGRFRRGSLPADPGTPSGNEAHNLALERRRRALKHLAKQISLLVREEKVQSWHFAAPKEINQQLRDALDQSTRMKIDQNVPLNLTKLPIKEILTHFYDEELPISENTRPQTGQTPARKTSPRKRVRFELAQSPPAEQLMDRPASPISRRPNRRRAAFSRTNVHRKPSARRTSPFKQMMRKETISPALSRAMRRSTEKGDRRRTVALAKLLRGSRREPE